MSAAVAGSALVRSAGVDRRPTRAAAVPAALGVLVGVLATTTGDAWLAAAAMAPVALGLASVICAVPVALRLQVARVALTGPTRVRAGEAVTHRVHLGWPAGARDEVTVLVTQPGTGPASLALDLDGSGGCPEADLVRVATHRVSVRTAEVRLVVTDVLRLFRWSRTVVVDLPLVVHPRRARPVAVPPGGGAHDAGPPRPARSGDLAGVRGWQRGDAVRDVHWRATARTGRPVVAVREQPDGGSCAVVLAGPVGPVDEDRVALCASTGAAVRADRPSSPVLVVTRPGAVRTVPAGPSGAQLDWWAAADLTGGAVPPPSEVLAAAGGRGTVLVVGTSALDEAWWSELGSLARRGRTTVVRVP